MHFRSQECAGSKDCNDTVFTVFDALAAPTSPTCAQPQLYRDGYDASGRISPTDAAAPSAAPSAAAHADKPAWMPDWLVAAANMVVPHVQNRLTDLDIAQPSPTFILEACAVTIKACRKLVAAALTNASSSADSVADLISRISMLDVLAATMREGEAGEASSSGDYPAMASKDLPVNS